MLNLDAASYVLAKVGALNQVQGHLKWKFLLSNKGLQPLVVLKKHLT